MRGLMVDSKSIIKSYQKVHDDVTFFFKKSCGLRLKLKYVCKQKTSLHSNLTDGYPIIGQHYRSRCTKYNKKKKILFVRTFK